MKKGSDYWSLLSGYWSLFKDRPVFSAIWEAMVQAATERKDIISYINAPLPRNMSRGARHRYETIYIDEDGAVAITSYNAELGEKVETPAVDITGNIMTLSCPTKDASIYYGFNEEAPTHPYTEPVDLGYDYESGLRVIAKKTGMVNSSILAVNIGTTISSVSMELEGTILTMSCAASGATIYYKIDDGEDTEYTDAINLGYGANVSVSAYAIKAGMTDSDVVEENYVTVPSAPTAAAADAITDTSFTAHWSDVSGETGYELDVSDDDFVTLIGDGSTIELGVGVTSYNVEGLAPGTSYSYRVRAVNAAGASQNSETISVALWTPALLTGINTWYDAKDLSTITLDQSSKVNGVAAWNCKINGASKQYTQSTGSAQPTLVSGAVFFDGSTSFMERTHNLAGTTNISFFYIFKQAASPTATEIFMSHQGSATMYNGLTSSATRMFGHNGTLLQTAESGMSAANLISAYHLFECNYIVNNAASRIVVYAHNGTDDISASGSMGNRTFNNTNKLIIGNLSTSWLKGSLIGIVSILGTISTDDLAKLRAFCQSYYGAA